MELSARDRRLLEAIEDGLPLAPRPFAIIARRLGIREDDVLDRLKRLVDGDVVRRFGVVVRHHELGYRANAMVVWDVPDGEVGEAGRTLAALPYVTLCYRRRRSLPDWPYNLFAMIHGRSRDAVAALIADATVAAGLGDAPRAVLFSRRRFKQRGASYRAPAREVQ